MRTPDGVRRFCRSRTGPPQAGPGARSAEGSGAWMHPTIPPSPPDKEKGLPKGSPFSLSGAGRDARCASPHALLCNAWAPPFAGLSPPLSGQPLNRGACSSRCATCTDRSPQAGPEAQRASGSGAWMHTTIPLSPPLSGQPLNRGTCSSRSISRSTPRVDAFDRLTHARWHSKTKLNET